MSQDKEPNNVTIKISGERTRVLKTLKIIKSAFPLFLEGKEKPNDNGDGIHIFLVVACSNQEA